MSKPDAAFSSSYCHEELVESFLLTPAEVTLALSCRGKANRCGLALLLKIVPYLGYVPDRLDVIPSTVREFIGPNLAKLEISAK